MRVRKGESHRALLLPVLLVLAAAFLATSLTGIGDNDITGAQIFTRYGGCEWVDGVVSNDRTHGTALCPSRIPKVISGGCNADYMGNLVSSFPSSPLVHPPFREWKCEGKDLTSVVAYCCK